MRDKVTSLAVDDRGRVGIGWVCGSSVSIGKAVIGAGVRSASGTRCLRNIAGGVGFAGAEIGRGALILDGRKCLGDGSWCPSDSNGPISGSSVVLFDVLAVIVVAARVQKFGSVISKERDVWRMAILSFATILSSSSWSALSSIISPARLVLIYFKRARSSPIPSVLLFKSVTSDFAAV